jgi:6-phosphogluconolactonase
VTRLKTVSNAEAVAVVAAEEIARHLECARQERGIAHIALSGGSTPGRTYELLAQAMPGWEKVDVWFADERCVAPTDQQSNYRLIAETLLKRTEIAPERVHRMAGELGAEEGAWRYAEALHKHVSGATHKLPVLDVVVLGIGPDGHIASLFPGSSALNAGDEAICLPITDSPKPPPQRITLSLAVLRATRRSMLLATGASKADAISAALADPSPHVPGSLLTRERLTVIVDDDAAPGPRH